MRHKNIPLTVPERFKNVHIHKARMSPATKRNIHTHTGIQRNIPLESKNIGYLLNSNDDFLRTLKADMLQASYIMQLRITNEEHMKSPNT